MDNIKDLKREAYDIAMYSGYAPSVRVEAMKAYAMLVAAEKGKVLSNETLG